VETHEVVDEGRRIVREAGQQGLTVRILGAVAFRIHCPAHLSLYESLERPITDLDLSALSRQRTRVHSFLASMGYTADNSSLMMYENRFIMDNQKTGLHADVFFDGLNMCHRIDWRDRLTLDSPTITVSDLLLEKMQIVRLEPKDIKDATILVLEHEVGATDEEQINLEYLCSLLSADWGFYYTVTRNLAKIREALGSLPAIAAEARTKGQARVDTILQGIEACPKTLSWRLRARVGTRRQWYQDVEERVR
jgi:hypothetical protein